MKSSENVGLPTLGNSSDAERNRTMRTTRPARVAETSPHIKGFGAPDPEKPTAEQVAQAKADYLAQVEISVAKDRAKVAARAKVDSLKTAAEKEQDTKTKKAILADADAATKEADAADAEADTAENAVAAARADLETLKGGNYPEKSKG